jgi:hypothetical protein
MKRLWRRWLFVFLSALVLSCLIGGPGSAATGGTQPRQEFPRSLESYGNAGASDILPVLADRISKEPINLLATLIFFCAILHTLLAGRFTALSRKWKHQHALAVRQGTAPRHSVHYPAELFHFLGEVEVVFGLWTIPLLAAVIALYGWKTAVGYLSNDVQFTEAIFVVVIMTLASTRPVLKLSEIVMEKIARLLGGGLAAWWFTILTAGPVLGSFITEPAAITISGMLLARRIYELKPGKAFRYATLGLLFVNISVGGTLTHFAAPPVLMVTGPWNWGTGYMLTHFGWKAVLGILVANGLYFLLFYKEFSRLRHDFAVQVMKEKVRAELVRNGDLEVEIERAGKLADQELGFVQTLEMHTSRMVDLVKSRLETQYLPDLLKQGAPILVREAFEKQFEEIKLKNFRRNLPVLLPEDRRSPFLDPDWDRRTDPVPPWVIGVHVAFMAWTIFNAHYPALFIPGLLFFLGFARVTSPFQNRIDLKQPLLVGFFLGGLVVHGGAQGWWIEPVLGALTEIPLMAAATLLTAFNDNAAVTYLSTLVPGFTDSLKYAVVSGAIAGGGLTVIANAPNPAGQSILKRYFEEGVSPAALFTAALLPTAVMWFCCLL